MSYVGVPPFGQTVRTITEVTATAGQTAFTPSGGYLPGYVDVSLNGIALSSADFTATNGTTVTLAAAAAVGDEFRCVAYWPVSLTDTYRKGETDTLLAAKQPLSNNLTTYAATGIGFRNRIINGDMRIDQRNAGASQTPTTDDTYNVDRWAAGINVASKFSMQQNTADAPTTQGFTACVKITSLSAYSVAAGDVAVYKQTIEGNNIADLAWGTASAKAVTLSFWVRSSLTGTFGGTLMNSAQNRAYPFTYTISAANTWEQKTVNIAGDTSGTWLTTNGAGIKLGFQLGVGSTFTGTAGSWSASNYWGATGATNLIATNGATFYITGVQLEAGSVASPFERRDYGRELIMCQRYYEKSFDTETAPSNGANLTSFSVAGYSVGLATNRLSIGTTVQFAVRKRAAPTITRYGNSAGELAWLAANGTVLSFSTNISYGAVNQNNFTFGQQVIDGTAIFCMGHWAASAEL